MVNPIANGSHVRGRQLPEWPTFESSSGYRVPVRKLSPDTWALIIQAAREELAGDKPVQPTERTEVAPNEWQDIPIRTKDYLEAVEAWNAAVRKVAGDRIRVVLEDYAIQYPVDQDRLDEYKAMARLSGISHDNETDKQIWIWRILLPSSLDRAGISAFAIGNSLPSPEAIAAQKATFRSDVAEA